MRLLLLGSGAFGVPTFEVLRLEHEVIALVGPPDRPAGRKRALTPAPAVAWALDAGVEAWRSENVNDEAFVEKVRAAAPDASVVIAFGQKLGEPLLAAMGRLSVNLHGSLLPAWRGAAPVQRSVMAGERTTGVSVIGLAQKMDGGPVYGSASLEVAPGETSGGVHDRLAALGPAAVRAVLDQLAAGTLDPQTQDESRATHAAKLKKTDGTTGFDAPAAAVAARINGLNPWPGCRVRVTSPSGNDAGELLLRRAVPAPEAPEAPDPPEAPAASPGTLLAGGLVATADGAIRLLEVQAPGKPVVPAADFLRGGGLPAGASISAIDAARR